MDRVRAVTLAVLAALLVFVVVGTSMRRENEIITTTASDPSYQNDSIDAEEELIEETDFEIIKRAIIHVQTDKNGGSGFVIDDNLALTAWHVVEGYDEVEVRFSNGARRIATVMGYIVKLDIALLYIPRIPHSVVPLELEFSQTPDLGESVLAWGYPYARKINEVGLNLTPSVTMGIISAHRKQLLDGSTVRILETDAAINSGNSGGPLIAESGKVVGINIAKLTPEGTDPEGLNFALDVTQHQEEIEALLNIDKKIIV